MNPLDRIHGFALLASALLVVFLTPRLSAQTSRLSNVSVRTQAGGADTLITGFTVAPGADKQILVRAVGPTLVFPNVGRFAGANLGFLG